MVGAGLDSPEDYVKPLVGIVLVQAHFKIRCRAIIGKIHRVPLDVKDAVGRSARN
jgi:hypothetical protein